MSRIVSDEVVAELEAVMALPPRPDLMVFTRLALVVARIQQLQVIQKAILIADDDRHQKCEANELADRMEAIDQGEVWFGAKEDLIDWAVRLAREYEKGQL